MALPEIGDKCLVRAAGLVISPQCSSAANGIVFVILDYETGRVNVVVWKRIMDKFRIVVGALRIAGRLEDHSHLLGESMTNSRDFQWKSVLVASFGR